MHHPERKNKDFSKGPVNNLRLERWVVQIFYPNGKRLRRKFRREKLAQRFWAGELQRIEQGTWNEVSSPRLALGEGIKRYRAFSKKHHRSHKTFVEPCLAFWEKELGKEMPLARITTADVEEIKLKRADVVSEATVDRSVQVLKAFFNWLIDHDLAATNPVRRVRMFHPNNEVVRYLTRDQYDALLQAAEHGPTYLKPLIVLAVHTALRRGNLLRLRWQEVDLVHAKIRVAWKTKGKKTLEIPINDAAKLALEQLRKLAEKDNDHVFPSRREEREHRQEHLTDIKTSFKAAVARAAERLVKAKKEDGGAGLKDFRFHDLRHTAASWLAMGGAGLPAIQKFLGHASIKMTLRYAHLSPEFLGQEAKILDRMLPTGPSETTGHLVQKEEKRSSSRSVSPRS